MTQDYGQLKNDAVNYYLQNGGTQSNVDAYFQQNPNQNYGQLASDAAQWYTNPASVADNQPSGSGGYFWDQDQKNQDVAGYFGIPAPAAGQNYHFNNAPQSGGQSSGLGNGAPAATQPYRGSPAIADPSMNVNGPVTNNGLGNSPQPANTTESTYPNYYQSTPTPIGAAGGIGQGQPTDVVPMWGGTGNNRNTIGGRGSLSSAQSIAGDQHYADVFNDPERQAGRTRVENDLRSAGYNPWGMDEGSSKPQWGTEGATSPNPIAYNGEKPILSGAPFDLKGVPEPSWLQSQFGIKAPDWQDAEDVIRYQKQLKYYWPDIIQRDPTMANMDPNGKPQLPKFLQDTDLPY